MSHKDTVCVTLELEDFRDWSFDEDVENGLVVMNMDCY